MKGNRGVPPLRVAILGGGPAGAFCAIWLEALARADRRQCEVTVFDHKDFDRPGPAGCNMCAGIIPDSLVRNMRAMRLDLPSHVIQRRLEGYLLETAGGAVDIPAPPGAALYATFRGPGPLGVYPAAQEGFDWWLLGEAQKRGAVRLAKLVTDVSLPAQPGAPYLVMCRDGAVFEAEVIVGAFGVNSNLGGVFERLGFGYREPRTVRARQTEVPVDPDFIEREMRNRVLIFAGGMPGLRFAAVTPKRRHVTVTLIGRNLGRPDLQRFLELPAVRKHSPRGFSMQEHYCSCAPRLPISAAGHPVSERLLVIGDANISRYLKNGIESSFYTAQWAARAIARGQVSSAELARRYYVAPARRAYAMDNTYGRLLLRLHDFISRSVVITRAHIAVARKEQAGALPGRLLTEVLWGMFTGNIPYRTILRKAFSLRLQARLLIELARSAARELRPGAIRASTQESRLGPLGSQQTAIIIGGGPAGASCAIALAREGERRRRAPRIILIEQKRFGEHQNQCAGVISLPGLEAIQDLLGVDVPRDLIQRDIRGYVLHTDGDAIDLSGEELGELAIALRRVQLDRVLLEAAQRCGVEVVHARASAVEVNRDGVVAYTDSGTFHGDVLIGAFGLDRGMAQEFARGTRYRTPAALETLACKLHPGGLDHIPDLLGDLIHVFLPPERRLEFGALIPKSNHVTVVVAGQGLRETDMAAFLTRYGARLLPPACDVQGAFKGSFPLGPARGLYGDRYVVIGDAAGLVRPFKGKGINAAIEAGWMAAATMLRHGISRTAFAAFARSRRHITRDLAYGRLVRWLTTVVARWRLLGLFIEQARGDPALRQELFDCVSGRTSYRDVVLRRHNLRLAPRMLWRSAAYLLGRRQAPASKKDRGGGPQGLATPHGPPAAQRESEALSTKL